MGQRRSGTTRCSPAPATNTTTTAAKIEVLVGPDCLDLSSLQPIS